MRFKDFMKNRYFYFAVITMLIYIIGAACYSPERDGVLTIDSQAILSSTPPTETPTIMLATNTQTATSEYTTLNPTSTLLLIPTETATPLPTIEPTKTRPVVEVVDSTNYMVVGNRMWHPDSVRMTEYLPIETGAFPWSPDGRQLVGLDNDGNIAIFTLQTSELRTFENVTASHSSAMWSPNGRYLSYLVPANVSDRSTWQLAVYDLENQSESLITEPIASHDYVSAVGWSHDSMKLAYIQWKPPITDDEAITVLKIVDVETRQTMEFSVDPPISILGGSWSPVDNQIITYGYDTQQLGRPEGSPLYAYSSIYLIDINSNSIETLIQSSRRNAEQLYYSNRPVNLFISNMPWSPDGKFVIYSDQGIICYLAIDSREETCLLETAEAIAQTGAVGGEYPSWSPTGDWIGFILKFDSLFCSPLAVIKSDNNELRYTEADAGDCAVFWGYWSPRIE